MVLYVNSMTDQSNTSVIFSKILRKTQSASCKNTLLRNDFAQNRAQLSLRLRQILTDHPKVKSFTVEKIISSLGEDPASVALFSAAGVFDVPDVGMLPGAMSTAYGVALSTGRKSLKLPRSLLRRTIPRQSLSLLVHAISSALDSSGSIIRTRWSWVFNPVVKVALGLMLFLLGLASMAPIIGGGAQYAASTFVVAVGLAEQDGFMVVMGALAGVAALAVAAISISSGRKLWNKIKAWLLRCARTLRLTALAHLLDRCCEGLGELARLRWPSLFLTLCSTDEEGEYARATQAHERRDLRSRAQRSRMAAERNLAKRPEQAQEPGCNLRSLVQRSRIAAERNIARNRQQLHGA